MNILLDGIWYKCLMPAILIKVGLKFEKLHKVAHK